MQTKVFKPLLDKLIWSVLVITVFSLTMATVISAVNVILLIFMILLDAACIFLLISPLFGYVELGESAVFVKFGLIMSREIPYSSIRGVTKGRGVHSDSMVSLKNAMEHVNIKHGRFDVTTVSVVGNDELIASIEERIAAVRK